METKPTHEQARLHLQIYEERREARLRQARDWFFKILSKTSTMQCVSQRRERKAEHSP